MEPAVRSWLRLMLVGQVLGHFRRFFPFCGSSLEYADGVWGVRRSRAIGFNPEKPYPDGSSVPSVESAFAGAVGSAKQPAWMPAVLGRPTCFRALRFAVVGACPEMWRKIFHCSCMLAAQGWAGNGADVALLRLLEVQQNQQLEAVDFIAKGVS